MGRILGLASTSALMVLVAGASTVGCGDGSEPLRVGPPVSDTSFSDGGSAQDDGPVRAEPDDDASFLFDDNALRTYELTVDGANLEVLDSAPQAEEYVEGRLSFEGQDVGPVGVRYKGSVGAFRGCVDLQGRKICTKISMKVKINWNDPEATFHGVRKLQFHSMNRDPSMMKERLGYWVFRQAGIAAPRVAHARVLLNGEFLGIFALVEQIDGRFTRSRFTEGGKGNLYKEAWPLTDIGTPVSPDTLMTQLRTNEDESPTFEKMLAFADALASAPVGDLAHVFATYGDIDYLMRYVAVDRAIAHDDGPFHWYCAGPCYTHNFYFYEEQKAARLWIVAWDLDSAFNIDNTTTTLWFDWDDTTLPCSAQSRAPFLIPLRPPYCDHAQHGMTLFQQRYLDATRALLEGPMQRDVLEENLLRWEQQIYPVVLEAAEAHDDAVTFDDWQFHRAKLRAAIDRLVARAEERVGRGPIPESTLLGGAVPPM